MEPNKAIVKGKFAGNAKHQRGNARAQWKPASRPIATAPADPRKVVVASVTRAGAHRWSARRSQERHAARTSFSARTLDKRSAEPSGTAVDASEVPRPRSFARAVAMPERRQAV